MRRGDLEAFVAELAAPVETFVRDSGVRLALLINDSGQVLAQKGFARAVDVVSAASLAAGIHASSRALAGLIGMERFDHLHQGGEERQVFIGPFRTPSEDLILVAVFGRDSSIGLVRVFFDALVGQIRALPGWKTVRPTASAADFERDLESGLNQFFGADGDFSGS